MHAVLGRCGATLAFTLRVLGRCGATVLKLFGAMSAGIWSHWDGIGLGVLIACVVVQLGRWSYNSSPHSSTPDNGGNGIAHRFSAEVNQVVLFSMSQRVGDVVGDAPVRRDESQYAIAGVLRSLLFSSIRLRRCEQDVFWAADQQFVRIFFLHFGRTF